MFGDGTGGDNREVTGEGGGGGTHSPKYTKS